MNKLYEVGNQLFAKANPDNDSVKTIVQLVANHFDRSEVTKRMKKLIKTRLQYLVESRDT